MEKPARLYKYEAFSPQALENLKNQVIYFNSPLQFNDPYDCALSPSIKDLSDEDVEKIRSHYLSRPDISDRPRFEFETMTVPALRAMLLKTGQDVLEKQVRQFVSQRGVSCFSEVPDNLLMWSHYASHHRGFCLEFRTDAEPFQRIRPVTYSKTMPEYDLAKMLYDRDFDHIESLYCTKGWDWSYEREWRCIHKEGGTAFTYAAEALTGVYFGSQASFTTIEIVALILAGQNEHVQLWQGARSKSAFSVEFRQMSYTSHLEAKRQGRL
ncbi:MAG TPA: DUF2971 domain-containing protein [Ramlibacter sp.]|uniref:DUF2971 domain-containing protein n=1 Tax=Ramlibacter sp. TaxID=1917967 RepID=UPI002CBA13D4|nr:DUF2971 domain-containing protein [Ramlibacter sp.]HVZ47069.1 DUF2971 domain-containing protein [Ramlibacter sp.]